MTRLVVAGCLALSLTAWAEAEALNRLSLLRVESTGQGAQVVVEAARTPVFSVFRLNDPDRLVVDVTGADAAKIAGHQDGVGPVAGVVTTQFTDERSTVARVMIALREAARYDVRADGTRLLIAISGGAAEAKPAEPRAQVEAKVAESPAPVAAAAEPAAREDGVVASRVDEQKVAHPAEHLTAVAWKKGELVLTTDGDVAKFELIELANPPRLAVDLFGLKSSAKVKNVHGGLLKGVRAGSWPEKVRLVLDVDGDMPAYQARRTTNGLKIGLSAASAGAVAKAAPAAKDEASEVVIDGQVVAVAETTPVAAAPVAPKASVAEVKELSFKEAESGGQVELKLTQGARFKVDRPDATSAVLTIEGASLPKRLERSLDTSALGTPITMVSAFAVPDDRVRVVVASGAPIEETVVKTQAGLSWRLSLKGGGEAALTEAKAAGFSSEASRFAEQGAPQKARYVGKKVSFEFKDIDIHNLLRIIAEVSKKNIVVADDVSGKVTIRLRNVPWDQALELILRSKGLGQEELGNNIVRVAPLTKLEEEARLRADRKRANRAQEDLIVQLVPVNYASAEQMQGRVRDVLTDRGNISVDARTNTLIVRDVGSNMGKVKSLVASLDTQTPQVLIESRIVEANTRYQREVGIQWGGSGQLASATGNATGLAFPNTVRVGGAAGNTGTDGVSTTPNWAVNLPVGIGLGSGGGLGFVFGSAGGALSLNLRLSALENQGVVKTISAPKVTTLDNSAAKISQGVSIPFSQVSAGGVNTSFIEARLSLEVTPHITADGSVLMTIRAENNQPDPANTGANGQPAIQRKEANTQVLVHDGDTTVIGGIYVRSGSSSSSGVPLLMKIPVLGFFFKNYREQESRQELLIFITPRILNRSVAAAN
ncbi:MAG: type IV pilus secretin PilQ [Myxococcaceae bacterium]|nr:type IV pilus secretin PilQ [Myxococcaceae bacterium]